MRTTVEKVREICKKKGIPVSKMEQALGFGNGFLNPKKAKDIKAERVLAIAEYLDVPLSDILGTDQAKKELTPKFESELSEKDIRLIQWFRSLPQGKQKAILESQDAPEGLV